ncbi:MAG: phage tail sheath subtilisin-like domain-containing protein [Holophagales bacterium]|jgi:phage tail sheath protein FI|nr:phage tail sheath subtilisin-like domain-containing protein [Holophagales bacterium]
MAGYHHGIEINETLSGIRGVNAPPTAVIGLIGTAPNFLGAKPDGKPVLVTSDKTAADFGPDLPGYTIPNALNAILDYGTARVIVIDVFDPSTHKSQVTGETVTLDDRGNGQLTNMGIITATVSYQGTAVTEGTDYKLDSVYGIITRMKDGALPPKAELTVTYEYGDPSLVTGKEVAGGINAAGLRTGIQAFADVPSRLGYKPRILIAPGYPIGSSVATALLSMAEKLRAHAYLDVPVGATIQQVIEGRGPDGVINLGTSTPRAVLCYPQVEVMDKRTEQPVMEPYSQNLAGLACNVDMTVNFWTSPSNHELRRVQALETPIQWSVNDPNCEANLLNEVGIVTIVRPFGKGFTTWGNRSAAWPSETHPINFINVRVVADYLQECVERILVGYMDRPLTKPVLNSAREDVLGIIENLIRQGALIGGSFTWPEAENPISEMSLGKVFYELSFLPPLPIDKITVRAAIDTTWLKNLYGG